MTLLKSVRINIQYYKKKSSVDIGFLSRSREVIGSFVASAQFRKLLLRWEWEVIGAHWKHQGVKERERERERKSETRGGDNEEEDEFYRKK